MLKRTLQLRWEASFKYAMPSQDYERKTGAEGSAYSIRPYSIIESTLSPSKPVCYGHAEEMGLRVRRAQTVGVHTCAAEIVVTRSLNPCVRTI